MAPSDMENCEWYCVVVKFLVLNLIQSSSGAGFETAGTYHTSTMDPVFGYTGTASTVHRQYIPGCTLIR